MRNQAYARAEAAYLQALQADPDDADVYSSLGAVYEAQRRPREAETAYRRALVLASDHTRARLNLSNLLRGEQRFDEAKAILLEALANDPRPSIQYEGHYYLGYLYLDQRDYLQAYGSFTTALEAEQRAEGFYALANAWPPSRAPGRADPALAEDCRYRSRICRCPSEPWSLVPAAR